LNWEGSADDGGCAIIQYRLFRDAGDGGEVSIEVHAADLAGNSAATGQVVTELPVDALGKEFVFQLQVLTEYTNLISQAVMGEASYPMLFAGVPGTPSSAPTRGALSGSYIIHIEIGTVAESNGAGITSYHIIIDDGLGGSFVEL
jgi:hypothetical protein